MGLKAESKWGEGFYERLSVDLSRKLPDAKCFSPTNLKYVKYFYVVNNQLFIIRPQLGDELKAIIFSIPWGHHKILISKFRDNPEKRRRQPHHRAINMQVHNRDSPC